MTDTTRCLSPRSWISLGRLLVRDLRRKRGGYNYAWTNAESLAAVVAREGVNNKEQHEKTGAGLKTANVASSYKRDSYVHRQAHLTIHLQNVPASESDINCMDVSVAVSTERAVV